MNEVKIQWHSGFVAAMELELTANRKDLVYEREYNLNTKPLEIDLLVIKKDKDIQVENEIGKLFRGHNILEYKSPEDHLNIDTLYKTAAYACLYKSYGNTVDERNANDITISIIREDKPEGLFQHLKGHEMKVSNPYKGIYYVQEKHLFPTQIIVTSELDREGHTWLKALSKALEKQELENLLKHIEELSEKDDKELADAVLEVSIRANRQTVEELRGDEGMCQALLEIMEPEISKIVGEATKKARRETENVRREIENIRKESENVRRESEKAKRDAEKARKEAEKAQREIKEEAIGTVTSMLKSGKFSIEEIKKYVPRLSIDEIRKIEKQLSQS